MKVTLNNSYLTLHWDKGKPTNFWYVWLYDNAPERRHGNGQKLTETRTVDLQVKPQKVDWTDEVLTVYWEGKASTYSVDFLRSSFTPKPQEKQLWKATHPHRIHNFERVVDQPLALYEVLKDIAVLGIARLRDVPIKSGMVLELIRMFGYPRETNYGIFYDVIAQKNPENLADTNLGLPCHTDNPYREPTPTIQVLHCLKADVEGGESLIVDGFQVAQDLQEKYPNYFELLSRYAVSFQYQTEDHLLRNTAPILELDKQGKLRKIKFNSRSIQPFHLPEEIMLPYYEAYQYLENQLHHPDYPYRFKLEPGEAIIYDNERILHGRSAFRLKSERHLQGAYADRDALLSKFSILQTQVLHEK